MPPALAAPILRKFRRLIADTSLVPPFISSVGKLLRCPRNGNIIRPGGPHQPDILGLGTLFSTTLATASHRQPPGGGRRSRSPPSHPKSPRRFWSWLGWRHTRRSGGLRRWPRTLRDWPLSVWSVAAPCLRRRSRPS